MLNTYWKYAGTRYKHKFKAIEASRGDIHNITYSLFDTSLENYDWTVEPAESLDELMRQRALQLRDTYTYLKLWFSGGSDSTTVLRVFLENNIPIDEIGVYRYYEPENESNQEVNNYTIPYLKSIQHLIPKTKIKIYCWDANFYYKYLNDNWFNTRSLLTTRHFYFPNIKGKNYCNIVCGQEPNLEIRNGKYYCNFWDTDAFGELSGFRNIEMFFTSPDLLELHAKQSYILKKYIKNNCDYVPVGAEYKDLVRAVLRDKAIAPEPFYFRKNVIIDGPKQWVNPKDKMMLNSMTQIEKDKFRYILSSTVGGIPMYRLYQGYKAFAADLGE